MEALSAKEQALLQVAQGGAEARRNDADVCAGYLRGFYRAGDSTALRAALNALYQERFGWLA